MIQYTCDKSFVSKDLYTSRFITITLSWLYLFFYSFMYISLRMCYKWMPAISWSWINLTTVLNVKQGTYVCSTSLYVWSPTYTVSHLHRPAHVKCFLILRFHCISYQTKCYDVHWWLYCPSSRNMYPLFILFKVLINIELPILCNFVYHSLELFPPQSYTLTRRDKHT